MTSSLEPFVQEGLDLPKRTEDQRELRMERLRAAIRGG